MRSYITSKTLIIGSAILLIGAVVAFANGGSWGYGGYGGHMMGYGGGYAMGPGMMGYNNGAGGYGMGPGMMGYGPGYAANGNGYGSNLSNEQRSRLEASRLAFYSQTQDLRNRIQDQRDALRAELYSAHPDSAKVGQLQRTLSGLEADYNQRVVQHQLELRKIAPDAYSGRGYGGYCRQ